MNLSKKYDFYKNSLYYLIGNSVLLIAAIIVMAICGFNYNSSVAGGSLLFQSVLSIIISSVAILVYVGIRYDFAKAFSIVLTVVHNVMLSTALIIIFRIPVTESIVMSYILLIGLSTVYTLMLTERLKDVNLKKADYNQIIKSSINASIKQIVLLSAIVVAILFLSLLVLNASTISLVRMFCVMLFVLIYSAFTVVLPSWCFFSSKIKKVKRAKVDQNVENQKVVKAATIDGEVVGTAELSENKAEE